MADLNLVIYDDETVTALLQEQQGTITKQGNLEDYVKGVANAAQKTIDRLDFLFTNLDLSDTGMLVKTHSKGKKPSSVLMLDPSGNLVDFDLQSTESVTNFSIAIPMQGFKIPATGAIAPGNWTLILGFN